MTVDFEPVPPRPPPPNSLSESLVDDVGGTTLTASRKKLRTLVPNLSRASSAASSAFSMSLSRRVASVLKRDSMCSASRTISAGRDSGRSGDSTFSLVVLVLVLVDSVDGWASEAVGELEVGADLPGSDWLSESARVRFTMEVKPLAACSLAWLYS